MIKIVQLIGPQASGKTTLRRILCPNAIPINDINDWGFLEEGTHFYTNNITEDQLTVLASKFVMGQKVVIYEGNQELRVPGSLIFRINIP